MLSHVLILVHKLDRNTILGEISYSLDRAFKWLIPLLTFLDHLVVSERFEEKVYLIPIFLFLIQGTSDEHLCLHLYEYLFITERDKTCSFPGQCTAVQIDVKVQWEELLQLVLSDRAVTGGQQADTLDGHDGEQLLEGRVGDVDL